jgi:hypothetical protein
MEATTGRPQAFKLSFSRLLEHNYYPASYIGIKGMPTFKYSKDYGPEEPPCSNFYVPLWYKSTEQLPVSNLNARKKKKKRTFSPTRQRPDTASRRHITTQHSI